MEGSIQVKTDLDKIDNSFSNILYFFNILYSVPQIRYLELGGYKYETYMKVSMVQESSMHASLQISDTEDHNFLKKNNRSI